MKIFYKKRHVKTIPRKFRDLPGLGQRFKDSKFKRLSRKERFDLEIELFVMRSNRPVRQLIHGLKVEKVQEVRTNQKGLYHVALFGNYRVRIPYNIFRLCDNKGSYNKTV
jgi:hypothetical protein